MSRNFVMSRRIVSQFVTPVVPAEAGMTGDDIAQDLKRAPE
ncbi:hypothetical protein [Sphingobium sp. EP60837]|nr:hypothetical protein [Sphingobium sp. EP60837]